MSPRTYFLLAAAIADANLAHALVAVADQLPSPPAGEHRRVGRGGNPQALGGPADSKRVPPALSKQPVPPRRRNATGAGAMSVPDGQASQVQEPSLQMFQPVRQSAYKHPLSVEGQTFEAEMVMRLSPTVLASYLKQITSLPSLMHPTRAWINAQATTSTVQYLMNEFENMGLITCLHKFPFSFGSIGYGTNVLAYMPGHMAKAPSVTLGAHYDSQPLGGSAPGAEDNGAGVAALLTIARALAARGNYRPMRPVYFAAFAAGHGGNLGSRAFTAALKGDDDQTLPVQCRPVASAGRIVEGHEAIIMDEIGWKDPFSKGQTVNLEAFDWADSLLQHLAYSNRMHNTEPLRLVHGTDPYGSDHIPFLNRGMKAVLTITSGDMAAYSHYHSAQDTAEKMSIAVIIRIARMDMGALIRMAGMYGYTQEI